MSLEEWGRFIASVDKPKQAEDLIRQLNVALAKMPLSHDEKMAIEFHWKIRPGMKTKREQAVYVYAKGLPDGFVQGTGLHA